MDAWGLSIYPWSVSGTVCRLVPLLPVGLEELFWRFLSLLFSLLLRWSLRFGTPTSRCTPSSFFLYGFLRFVFDIRPRKIIMPELRVNF